MDNESSFKSVAGRLEDNPIQTNFCDQLGSRY